MSTDRHGRRQCQRALLVAFLFSGGVNLLMLATPLFTLQIFDRVVPSRSIETLVFLAIVVIAALLAMLALETARDRVLVITGHWLDREFARIGLIRSLAGNDPGNEVAKQAKAAGLVRNVLSGPAVGACFDAPWTPLFLILVFMLHPYLGLAVLISALMLVVSAMTQAEYSSVRYQDMSGDYERAESWRRAVTGNADLTLSLGMAQNSARHWSHLADTHLEGSRAYNNVSNGIKSFVRFLRLLTQIAIFGIGAYLIVGNEISVGALIASSILAGRALAPLEQAVNSLKWVRAAWDAISQLRRVGAGVGEVHETILPSAYQSTGKGGSGTVIHARRLSFNYPRRPVAALSGCTLTIERGECVAMIGPNGSGKSTLIRLLAGEYVPNTGSVQMDGVAVRDWQRDGAQRRIGYLPDRAALYPGTVADNIGGFSGDSLLSVAHSAMRAGVHDILSGLPDGYDTLVTPDEEYLSLTEQRAIGLARAFHSARDVLLLDEPEVGLDGERSRRLARAISDYRGAGGSVVFSTLGAGLLGLADRVLVLNHGTIARFGRRDDVLAQLNMAQNGETRQAGERRAQ